jgi:hypothetical protein
MVDITLSPEQVRNAPPEVRRWIEQELLVSFGLRQAAPQPGSVHLVALTAEDVVKILSLIQGMIPVVNVLFELGRQGASAQIPGVEAYRLIDILRHGHLQSEEQVIACLDAINQAFSRVHGDEDAVIYGLDGNGHCLIAAQTQHSIFHVWQQIVANHTLESAARPAETSPPAPPAAEASFSPRPIWSAPPRVAIGGEKADAAPASLPL